MTAKSFVDTNVVLYTIGKDARKADIARELIGAQPAVSIQVVNESISVCQRKLSFTGEKAYAFGRTVMDQTVVLPCLCCSRLRRIVRPAVEFTAVSMPASRSNPARGNCAGALTANANLLYFSN
jgi:hypothetical protein